MTNVDKGNAEIQERKRQDLELGDSNRDDSEDYADTSNQNGKRMV